MTAIKTNKVMAHPRLMRLGVGALLGATLTLLTACGLKGDLYLEDANQQVPPAAVPAQPEEARLEDSAMPAAATEQPATINDDSKP